MLDNGLYKITEMLNDKDKIQNDMQEILNDVSMKITEKYVGKINNILKENLAKSQENPTKEVRMLQAMKYFVPEKKRDFYDKMSDMLTMVSTFNGFIPTDHSSDHSSDHSTNHSTNHSKDHSENYPPNYAQDFAPSFPPNYAHDYSTDYPPNYFPDNFSDDYADNFADNSIHHDGIYDLDKQCVINQSRKTGGIKTADHNKNDMSGMLMMMMLMGKNMI